MEATWSSEGHLGGDVNQFEAPSGFQVALVTLGVRLEGRLCASWMPFGQLYGF